MTEFKNTLKPGTVLHGENYDFTIVRIEKQDGFGVNYVARGVPHAASSGSRRHGSPHEEEFIVREHFMFHCSHRDADGVTVVTPPESVSTVSDFRKMFDESLPWFISSAKGHDSLIQILDFFQANNTSYYAVENPEGPTLFEYVMANGPIPIAECEAILTPIFMGVRYLHYKHLLHTDLSPHSIIIAKRPDGTRRPVLKRHYGCKAFVDRAEAAWRLPPMSCPDCYAPVEQYGEMDKFLPQTNVYSLSAILLFMLTAKEPPRPQDVTDELLRSILPKTLPEEFIDAVVKGMAPDWHDRPVNVSDLRSSLIEAVDLENRRQRERELAENPSGRNRKTVSAVITAVAISLAILALIIILYHDTGFSISN